jgi:hypothetical protein
VGLARGDDAGEERGTVRRSAAGPGSAGSPGSAGPAGPARLHQGPPPAGLVALPRADHHAGRERRKPNHSDQQANGA